MKKSVIVKGLGLLVGITLMASALGTSPGWAKELQIAVLLPTMDQPFMVQQKYGYEITAKQLGIKLTFYDAGSFNLNRQIQQIEDATAKKFDAIIITAADRQGTVPAIDDAVRAGVPVINVSAQSASQSIVARVRSDDIEIGRQAGEFLAKKLNYKGNIIMLAGKAGVGVIMDRAEGVKEVTKKYQGMKVLAERYTDMTRALGMNTMEDLLQAYGKNIHGVYAVGEHLGMGAAKALEAANRRDVAVCAVDFSEDLERAIRDGWIQASIVQQTIVLARTGLRIAKDVAEGKQVPKVSFVPTMTITKENLDTIDRSGFQIPAK